MSFLDDAMKQRVNDNQLSKALLVIWIFFYIWLWNLNHETWCNAPKKFILRAFEAPKMGVQSSSKKVNFSNST